MTTNDERLLDAAAYSYMRMVAEKFEPGTLSAVLAELPADQRQALEEASDREQARREAAGK